MHDILQVPFEAVVVSGTWPSVRTGYGIAVAAALREYCKFFSRVHFFGPARESFDDREEWEGSSIEWRSLPLVRGAKWWRFLRSIGSRLPAITIRYQAGAHAFLERMSDILQHAHARGATVVVIFEDVPAACYLPLLRQRHPAVPQAIRSHNCLVKGFAGLEHRQGLVARLAWRVELAKILQFEKAVCESADALWAITAADAVEYKHRLGIEPAGIIGISVNTNRYLDVPQGNLATVVHVGSADLRKGNGLTEFIVKGWPLVHAAIPHARLILGGRGTERFHNPRFGVEGLGFVKDDRDVLGRGAVFVNPQEIGAGIKLKSAIAMLAGKALVSTPTGIEGVEGRADEHFVTVDDSAAMAKIIVELIRDPERIMTIGQHARALAAMQYSQDQLCQTIQPVIDTFVARHRASKRLAG